MKKREIQTNVILSIKPKFVKEIMAGNKLFEYRKKIFKKDIDRIYIYESSPVQKITGFFTYKGFMEGTPDIIWEKTKKYAGIEEVEFKEYFKGHNIAYAIIIEEFKKLENPIEPKSEIRNFTAPQSYRYIEAKL